MAVRLLVGLVLAATVAEGFGAKATPIEKVTQLMKGLQAKITEEGKKEAAAYDKYACFCKEQADEKLYSIEKSGKLIGKLKQEIKALDADIASLNGDISKLSGKVSDIEDKMKKESDARAGEHDTYLAKAKDLNEAIDACAAAIQAMKDAKTGLKGAKVNLVQVQAAVSKALGAPKYQFQGNDIIATLEDLAANFNKMKKDLDQDEFDVNSVFEKEALGDANEKQFANQEKDEKSALAESKTEEVMSARENKDEETKDQAADQLFLDTLTAQGEDKAKLFDQRSSTRADELAAMTDAIAQLEEGVKPNAGANKKLVGLVQSNLAPSFIQVAHTLQQDSNRAVKRVQELLQEAASRLDSKVLQGAVSRVQISADHFVKVRGLINDLISKLEADAKSEAEQKSFCDKAMKKAVTNRDEGKAAQEAAQAKLTTLNALKEELNDDIADLMEKIAQNKKAVNEAMELRTQEKADNEETLDQAGEGKEAVNMALNILGDFYKNAFLQTKYTPPGADRDGNSVGDLAPATETESYHGAQGEATGIIGILEVIASDFERTITKVTADEKDAQAAFDKFEKETTDDSSTMQDSVTSKDGKVKVTEGSIIDEEQALKDATELYGSGVEKLEDLQSSCVEGEETWEERAAARKKEIEALKQAQTILDDWQA